MTTKVRVWTRLRARSQSESTEQKRKWILKRSFVCLIDGVRRKAKRSNGKQTLHKRASRKRRFLWSESNVGPSRYAADVSEIGSYRPRISKRFAAQRPTWHVSTREAQCQLKVVTGCASNLKRRKKYQITIITETTRRIECWKKNWKIKNSKVDPLRLEPRQLAPVPRTLAQGQSHNGGLVTAGAQWIARSVMSHMSCGGAVQWSVWKRMYRHGRSTCLLHFDFDSGFLFFLSLREFSMPHWWHRCPSKTHSRKANFKQSAGKATLHNGFPKGHI